MGTDRVAESGHDRRGPFLNRFAHTSGGHAAGGAVRATAVVVALLAAGCGSHPVASKSSQSGRVPAPPPRPTSPHAKSSAVVGPTVGTCPKLIAANCIPGVQYESRTGIVCVGHGNVRTARTPTPADLRRVNKESAKADDEFRKTGRLPYILRHPPSQVFLHMLPGGKARGICVWGKNPAAVAANTEDY